MDCRSFNQLLEGTWCSSYFFPDGDVVLHDNHVPMYRCTTQSKLSAKEQALEALIRLKPDQGACWLSFNLLPSCTAVRLNKAHVCIL